MTTSDGCQDKYFVAIREYLDTSILRLIGGETYYFKDTGKYEVLIVDKNGENHFPTATKTIILGELCAEVNAREITLEKETEIEVETCNRASSINATITPILSECEAYTPKIFRPVRLESSQSILFRL